MSLLKRGLKGAPVKRLQQALGINADGDFGPATEKALRAYQEKAGLAVDGIAGPDTFTALGLHELVLLRQGSRGRAVKDLQTALGIDADGIFGSGTEKAVMDFSKAIELKPDYAEAWLNRGTSYFMAGKPERAIKDLTQSLKLNPALPNAYLNRGHSFLSLKYHQLAIKD